MIVQINPTLYYDRNLSKKEILIFSLIVRINREINKKIVSLLSFFKILFAIGRNEQRNRMDGLHTGGHPFSYKIINFNILLVKA